MFWVAAEVVGKVGVGSCLCLVKITKIPLPHLGRLTPISFVCHFSFQLHLFATSAFSSVCLQLQLSASFVGSSAFASLIFICLFLLDINDVYSLDVFLLKIDNQHDSFLSSLTTV